MREVLALVMLAMLAILEVEAQPRAMLVIGLGRQQVMLLTMVNRCRAYPLPWTIHHSCRPFHWS